MTRRVRNKGFTANVVALCGSFEPCGPQPWPAQARKHPAGTGRAPQAAPESQALCHSERSEESFPLRTKGRGRTMPRKEENDKRSAVKNLFWARLQILRRYAPQNDNAVFALNHFLSGTHSSARLGRLRGSHLRCEPARAQGLPYQKEKEPAIIVMLSEAKHLRI